MLSLLAQTRRYVSIFVYLNNLGAIDLLYHGSTEDHIDFLYKCIYLFNYLIVKHTL